jgi:hypothetical protein
MSADRMPISRGIAPLADIPDREGRDGGPELVIRGEHPVIAMPVLPRRGHEVSESVQDVTRREFDDAVCARPRGLPPAPRADPVGRLMSRQHVADADDAAVGVADHGEPFQREGWTGTVSQKMLETFTVARDVAVDERDPDAGVHREPTVFSSEHVGGPSPVGTFLIASSSMPALAMILEGDE